MKDYQNGFNVHLMIWETCKIKRQKGEHKTNLNLPKTEDLNIGDKIYSGLVGCSNYWTITEIISKKKSSLSTMNYYETKANFTLVNNGS